MAAIGLPANAAPSLPTKTPQQVLGMVAAAHVDGLTGDVLEKSALGLPALPSSTGGGPGAAGLTGLLSGTHSLRVWVGKAGQLRAQVLDTLDETDIVSDGVDLWTYVYSTNEVSHLVLPAKRAGAGANAPKPTPDLAEASLTPGQLAAKLLAAADPTTEVSVSGTTSVAGRDAYLLDIRPRTADTTVGVVRIAVDATNGVPLRVQIFARGATSAALTIGFGHVSFGAIDASKFHFTAPPGARTSSSAIGGNGQRATLPTETPGLTTPGPTPSPNADATATQPRLVGTGWASVLVLPHTVLTANLSGQGNGGRRHDAPPSLGAVLGEVGTPVPGGRLLHTALINVLAADDGRVLVGAVPASILEKALTAPTPTG
jgi:outer membrane lipoprotein-sorting protein